MTETKQKTEPQTVSRFSKAVTGGAHMNNKSQCFRMKQAAGLCLAILITVPLLAQKSEPARKDRVGKAPSREAVTDLNGDGRIDYLDVYEANKSDGILSRLDDMSGMPQELLTIRKTPVDIRFKDPKGLVDWSGWQSDASRIIYDNGRYYMFFVRMFGSDYWRDPERQESSFAYATSADSQTWTVQGLAPIIGQPGDFDGYDCFCHEPIRVDGKYYMFYQAFATAPEAGIGTINGETGSTIGLCVAKSLDGPWTRVGTGPILTPSKDPNAWDYVYVCNPRPMYIGGKWLLYYKGMRRGVLPKDGGDTFNGVAIANQITGPYVKYKHNPLLKGHGHFCWRYKNGMLMIPHFPRPPNGRLLWSEDGIHFGVVPGAPSFSFGSLYLPNDPWSGEPVQDHPGSTWGIESVRQGNSWDLQGFKWEIGIGPEANKPAPAQPGETKKQQSGK